MAMKTRSSLGFAALCLLSGSGWMIDQFYPPVLNGPARVAVQDGLLALLFFTAASLKEPRRRLKREQIFELGWAGAALLAVPAVVGAGASGQVADLDGVLCYAAVPAIVVFLLSQYSSGFGAEESPLRLLVPALAGLGGAALILPFALPPTLAGKMWLLVIVASASVSAYAAIRLHRALTDGVLLWQSSILCSAAAVVAASFWRVGYASVGPVAVSSVVVEVLRTLLLDAPMLLLLVYLLRAMPPAAISTRLLLIPLVTIVESYLIERPPTEWTTFAGMILMAAAAYWLLSTAEPEDL
jgi:hypothetical protein